MKWHTAKYGDPYSEFVLCIYPSKCTHRAVNTHTHTHWEHTPWAVGSHLCCGARGAIGGLVPCSRAPRSGGLWGWRERCTFTPPHTYNSCQTWDLNSQPLGYESDSLTMSPHSHGVSALTLTLLVYFEWSFTFKRQRRHQPIKLTNANTLTQTIANRVHATPEN